MHHRRFHIEIGSIRHPPRRPFKSIAIFAIIRATMKSLASLLVVFALAVGVFGSQTSSSTSIVHESMSPQEHASMGTDCASGACTTLPTDCATHCFMASSWHIDSGVLPGLTTLFLVVLATALILTIQRQTERYRRAEPIGFFDPRLILTIQKRE